MLLAVAVVLPALGLVVLHLVSDFGLSEQEIRSRFESAGVAFELKLKEGISYVETGNPAGPTVIFVHGSPGSWDNFISYLLEKDLRQSYRLLALNRPGYGGDSRGRPEPSLRKQAEAVMTLVPEGTPVLVVGHSMGGPIAVRMAVDYPEQVQGLLLLSAALDPERERVLPIQRIGNHPLIAWMLPSSLDVCNRELLPLREELEALEPEWKRLTIPVVALHGEKDGLVPVENMDYLRRHLPAKQLDIRILEGENHFIPWTREADVIQAVKDLLIKVSAESP